MHLWNTFESLESRLLMHAGDIDLALNDGTLVTTGSGSGGLVLADTTVLADGSIIAVGYFHQNTAPIDAAIVKYNFDGTLDTSFGSGGEIIASPRGMTTANKIQVGSDGSLYVLGNTSGALLMLKFTPAGKVDTTFASNGALKFTGLVEDTIHFDLDPTDHILVTGQDTTPDLNNGDAVGVLRRYTSSGKVDANFHGGTDFVLPPLGTTVNAQYRTIGFGGVTVDTDGNILLVVEDSLVADHFGNFVDETDNYLYRLTASGKIDRSFSSAGHVNLPKGGGSNPKFLPGGISDLTLLADGQIMISVGGHLSRYNADGTLDQTYGSNGLSSISGVLFAIALDGSAAYKDTSQNTDDLIGHLRTDGKLDMQFGTNGTETLFVESSTDFVNALTFAPDGTIVVGGQTGDVSPSGRVDTRSFLIDRLFSGEGPAVQLVPRTLKSSSRYLSFNVLIRDNSGIDTSTLDDTDLKLFDASGNTRKIRFLSETDLRNDATYVRATYRIIGPNSSPWTSAANGRYEVRLQRKQFADTGANTAAAQVLGSVHVKIGA